ncbi:signal recognition particle-docking protein FtsY [Staphylococcus massiliensis]|uniref:Signal recognition particle receptor FtsY n=1 Tax=Staphylococcus massiliensis S46 TaxID=1229783 RepID=K9B6L0_9STAP|nr:signal recognition particle-docking protein FtsY [Staphylococcus massiliensis]EKU50442.1 signal recognition particle-docking protein FtsY [Staphylococcus massiliensis S46]MCG3398788.1 signal recognition particle-docking protein FtsY [Staphylococcus massiliensis]MCG3401349.1 signal recognition particle-docking protein FtsY [Staphylococcus massiliensis]MCG3411869.1 signal recognition particle-docking protein FtsY [Staphylococcus massiliensis]POA00483.1 signal recognition particle-docking prot
MSFFKRLRDKFSQEPKERDDFQEDLEELEPLDDEEQRREEEPPSRHEPTPERDEPQAHEAPSHDMPAQKEVKHDPISPSSEWEMDFDDDDLISIEEFEEIESQKLGAKFRDGLEKSRHNFQEQLNNLIARYRKVDEEFFEALEEMLIQADVGFTTVMDLVDELRMEAKRRNIQETEDLREVIVEKIVEIYRQDDDQSEAMNLEYGRLNIILMVGVNGVGKTTSIAKLAHRYESEDKKVMLAAGDTFRAGAIEQLQVWGDRIGVEVVSQKEGSDPAAVMYDAINAAKNKGADVLICDTAGRLQNKQNLMNELEKVKRVIGRAVPDAPHEVLLCLDATTGQNAISQAKAFKDVTDVTGIVLTKLDGTAKGGIVLAIRNEMQIPVKYVGLGEKLDDLTPFDPESYVYGLFADMIEQNVPEEDKDQPKEVESGEQYDETR